VNYEEKEYCTNKLDCASHDSFSYFLWMYHFGKGIPPDNEKPNGGSNQANNFLNQTEKEGLIYIAEEEKLSRDLNGFFMASGA